MPAKMANYPEDGSKSAFYQSQKRNGMMSTARRQLTMKKIQDQGILMMAVMAAGAALLFSGCGTTKGYKQADKTGAGIAEFRDEIAR